MRLVQAVPVLLCLASLGGTTHAAELCGRTVVSIEQMVSEIKAQPGASVAADTREFVALIEPAQQILWTFAKPVQPLGSAYICRKVVEREGRIVVELRALCNGPKPDCDGLIARILADQDKATARFRQQ